ncbi:MAG: hypothetical protein IPN22_02890 [Bacteroidetes bacterium]|nr:hypothetical protein [Bacteroidota bacterium]
MSKQIFYELKIQYPSIQSFVLQRAVKNTEGNETRLWICNIKSKTKIEEKEKKRIEEWLKVRIKAIELIINFEG